MLERLQTFRMEDEEWQKSSELRESLEVTCFLSKNGEDN
jgi:hypothetical protein